MSLFYVKNIRTKATFFIIMRLKVSRLVHSCFSKEIIEQSFSKVLN